MVYDKNTNLDPSSSGRALRLIDPAIVPASARAPFVAPSAWLAALEMRAAFEFMAFMASSPALLSMPRGDGHPVMVLPPFVADDGYTAPLRGVLESLGYAVHGWRQGSNLNRTVKIVEGLPRRLLELHERAGPLRSASSATAAAGTGPVSWPATTPSPCARSSPSARRSGSGPVTPPRPTSWPTCC